MRIRFGISTCPNDTYAFHGLLTGAVRCDDHDLEVELLDIQELNERLLDGTLDAGKVSFAAALRLADQFALLPAGSALGFGVGPLLLAAKDAADRPPLDACTCLCPGADTTATLLLHCLHPEIRQVEQRHFAAIMPALSRGEADLGVVIHEGRFTYVEHDLHCVEDLGARFEGETGSPVPLGGLIARKDLGEATLQSLDRAVLRSLRLARRHPDDALVTMRRHAQELSDLVIWRHVELYVNDHTFDLGEAGRRCLEALQTRALAAGLCPPGSRLEVVRQGGE
jgi:1,4-dihydroxy-6-naphthoate synthase